MGAKRILLLVFGSLIALVGLGLAIGGAVGLIAYGTGRDSDGFFTTDTERFATPRYALVSDEADLGAEGDAAGSVSLGDLARVRVRAEALTGQPVFVGIGPREDVQRYLAGVAYDEVTDVEFDPFRVAYRARPGSRIPAAPDQQTFWAARATGPGQQALEWDLEGGEWNLVVMNADASPRVLTDIQLGVEIKVLLPVSIGLLIGGLVLLGIGVTMIVFGARGGGGGGPPPAEGEVPGAPPPPRHPSPY
jgi:hypothetical protein